MTASSVVPIQLMRLVHALVGSETEDLQWFSLYNYDVNACWELIQVSIRTHNSRIRTQLGLQHCEFSSVKSARHMDMCILTLRLRDIGQDNCLIHKYKTYESCTKSSAYICSTKRTTSSVQSVWIVENKIPG